MILLNINELDIIKYKGRYRVLCLDYGNKRIGVAISDINWEIASPLTVIDSNKPFDKIKSIISEKDVGVIVLGLPMNMHDSSISQQAEKVTKFTEKLDNVLDKNIQIIMFDERLSSVAAHRSISEFDLSKTKVKKVIDKVAASFILTGFLDTVRNRL